MDPVHKTKFVPGSLSVLKGPQVRTFTNDDDCFYYFKFQQ